MRVCVWFGRFAVIAAAVGAAACSTVMRAEHASEQSGAHQRAALVEAASVVARTPWPQVQNEDWGGRFLGGTRTDAEAAAAEFYLARLSSADRKSAVLEDAAAHLAAAAALAAAAQDALNALVPTRNDVAVVESAIGDLRGARSIYVESLKMLARERAVEPAEIREVKRAFDEQMDALGEVADALAARVEAERSRSFAGPRIYTSS